MFGKSVAGKLTYFPLLEEDLKQASPLWDSGEEPPVLFWPADWPAA